MLTDLNVVSDVVHIDTVLQIQILPCQSEIQGFGLWSRVLGKGGEGRGERVKG